MRVPVYAVRTWRKVAVRWNDATSHTGPADAEPPSPQTAQVRRAASRSSRRSPEPRAPNVEEIAAEGLRWVKIDHPRRSSRPGSRSTSTSTPSTSRTCSRATSGRRSTSTTTTCSSSSTSRSSTAPPGGSATGELDLFVGPGFLVTIPNQPLQPVEYLFERCRQKEELRDQLFSRGSGYLLYRIVDDGFDYCFPMLRKIGNKLDALEEEIFEGRSEEIVRDISNVKQEIINFRKVIRPQRPVLRDLEQVKQRYLAPEIDLEIYFDDIVDAQERIWDMLENYKEVVEALEDTNESVISHRVNDILRVLTSISVIVLPLTLLASLWGMNVGVPGEGDDDRLLDHRRRDGRPRWSAWSPTSAAAAGCSASIGRCGQLPDLGALAPRLREGRGQGRRGGVHLLRRSRQASDDEANLIVHRGERCFVILNKFPYTNGHLMVAPYEHMATLPEVDAETIAEMMALAQRAMAGLEQRYSPHGYNVGFNQGRVAGAGFEHHIHMHVVPRWGGDTNFMPVLADTRVMPQTLEQSYEALRGAFD